MDDPMTNMSMLTAEDIMTRSLVTLRPDTAMLDAIKTLLHKKISGAPVVEESGKLVGMLSGVDCLRVLAVDEYNEEEYDWDRPVAAFMTKDVQTIPSTLGIYSIADRLLTQRVRRFPVVDGEKLIGLVSRTDVLRGIERMMHERRRPKSPSKRDPKLYLSATDTDPGVIGSRLK